MQLAAEISATLLLMAAVPVLVKLVAANAITIGIVRLAIATAGVGAWVAGSGQWHGLRAADWRALASIGSLFALHWLTYFVAIKISSASIAAIGASTFGVHLVVLGWLVGHHRVRGVDVVAVTLAVAGTLLVAPEWHLGESGTRGLLLAAASAFVYAVLPLLHQRHAHLPSRVRALGQFGFALPWFLALGPWANWQLAGIDWLWLAVLGVACTLVAHTLWTHLSTVLPTLVTSVVFYLQVPVALLLSVTVLGDRVTLPMLTGAGLIVGGNVLALRVPRGTSIARRPLSAPDADQAAP